MPSRIGSAVELVVFSTICAGALTLYHYKQLTQKKTPLLKDDRLKVIVISGCDRGFGLMMAQAWCELEGYQVVALTLTTENVRKLEQENGKLVAIQCDVTLDREVQMMKSKVQNLLNEKNAVLYAIVNNAGIADPGDFCFYDTIETPKQVMEVNYFGQLRVTQALLPLMICTSRTAGGKIFNMSSVCGTSATAGNSAYNASKFAVEAWSDSLRLELEPFQIQVCKVRPGATKTAVQNDFKDNYLKNYKNAPEQILNLYGSQAFADAFASAFDGHLASTSDPKLVIDTLTELIQQEKPLHTHYWVGADANTFWKAMNVLPAHVSSVLKSMLATKPLGPNLPPPETVAHVTIRVKDIYASLAFYSILGFETIGDMVDGQQFLQFNPSPKCKKWQSLVLLKEDKNMPERHASSDAGMTRLCIFADGIHKLCQELETKHSVKPIAPTAYDGGAYIAAYKDPDGFTVYFIEATGVFRLMVNLQLWTIGMRKPFLFHWTINVTEHEKALAIFEGLGFQTMSDQNKDQVLNGLLPAFNIDPKTTVIDWIRLCFLPKGGLVATIMNWNTPRSAVNRASATNAMTLSVADVGAALAKARELGMYVEEGEKPTYKTMPIYGNVLSARAFVEKGSAPIEFCCFSNQEPLGSLRRKSMLARALNR